MHLIKLTISLALLVSSLTSTVSAEEGKFESLTVIATRDQQPTSALANSLSLIDQKTLQLVSPQHISELMVRSSGTWISRGNGQESLTAIRSPVLTGAGSCGAFFIAEDGVAIRPTGFCNANQLFDVNTEQAQRIEVLRGPGTAIHGSNALHGVINVVSYAPSQQLENTIGLELGPHDYGRLQYSGSSTRNEQGIRLSINSTHDGGYKDDSGFDQQKISLRHDYRSDQLSVVNVFNASKLNQETAGYVEGFEAYKDDSRKKENGNPEVFRDSQSARFYSKITQDHGDNKQLVITPYIRTSDMRFLMHFLPGNPIEENGQKSIGVQSAFLHEPLGRLSLTTGFDAELTSAYLKQSQQGGFSVFPNGKQYDYEVDAVMWAGFLSSSYTASPATRYDFGLRYESLHYDYNNKMIDGTTTESGVPCRAGANPVPCRYSRPADRQDQFRNGSLNASVMHSLNDSQDIVLRIARAFRAPQASELYRLQAGQSVTTINSEQLDSIELSLRDNRGTVSYSLTAFAMKKDNVIFKAADRSNLDNGKTEHYGLEYDLNWQISSDWYFTMAGTFVRHQYASDMSLLGASFDIKGNDIDTAPRTMASAQLGWQATDKSYVELEWVHMGDYYTDIDNVHRYEGHELLNLRFRYQLNQQWLLGLRINNLADQDYAERADYLVTPFKQVDRYFIGEPRSVFAELTVSF